MKLYSENNGLIIDTSEHHTFNQGTYSRIYDYNEDTCFKVFKEANIYRPEPIIILKSLDLKNFYQIIDLLYDSNHVYSGYLMKLYQSIDKDILTDKEYLVESVNNIYDSISCLTRNNILVSDLHRNNLILTSDGIIMLDCDDFTKSKLDETSQLNNFRFKSLLTSLLFDCLVKKHNPKNLDMGIKLVQRLVEEDRFGLDHFNKTMNLYQKPIDYFNKAISRW